VVADIEMERSGAGPDLPFAGQVALVTGASRGIGAATARRLADGGATVAVNFRHSKRDADGVVRAIEAAGGRAAPFQADVVDEDAVTAMVENVEESLGPIDVLVLNAAGFTNPARGPFLKIPQKVIEEIVLNQVRAFLLPVRAIAPSMIERGRGTIVVVTSGQVIHPAEKFLALPMAKGAIETGVRALARELGPHGIRVNAVAPGLVLSDATKTLLPQEYKEDRAAGTPLRRLPEPDDIAGPIVMMAGPQAAMITGATVQVNGGLLMR
jgi:3-oxoacyl-[acyl-carrier protein] reductase